MRKFLILLLLCPFLSMCQPLSLRGKVIDEKDDPIAGATVAIRRTGTGSFQVGTNDKGEFVLPNLRQYDTLVVTAVGFEPFVDVLDFRFRDQITVQLRRRTAALDDVVVIAYGTTTRRLNTGSVGRVTAEDISHQPVQNPLSALDGRVAGLTIVQSSGVPGASIQVQLRGQASITQDSEPLFLIDGVPFAPNNNSVNQLSSLLTAGTNGLSPFSTLNPADIQSIEVLKDADATAIYGSRGANGVVLITTKKGTEGKPRFTLDYSQGFSRVTRTAPMLNTLQYVQMRREAFAADGVTPDQDNAPDLFLWDTTRYTDFTKRLLGGTAMTNNAQATFSGGRAGTTFFFSGGYRRETTVFPGSLNDARGTFSAALSHAPEGRRYAVDFSASYSMDRNLLSSAGVVNFINLSPNAPALLTPDGHLAWEEGGLSFTNPLAYLQQPYKALSGNLTGRLQASYQILPGLSLLSSFGYNAFRVGESLLIPIASQDPTTSPVGSASWGNRKFESWIAEPRLQYKITVRKSAVEVLLGTTLQRQHNTDFSTEATGYTSDALLRSLAAAPGLSYISNSESDYRYAALFGRLRYNLSGKYVVNISGRRDGSSRFGPGRQYASFGALGAAWIFSSEKGIQKALPFLSYGKLRGSYGTTGNDQIGNYRFLDVWSVGRPYAGGTALYPSALYNPTYSWEINKKLEGALELGFFANRILFTAAYFRNRSSNQLVEAILPAQTGFFSVTDNLPAKVQNRGWELELTTVNLQGAKGQWTTSFNITMPRNTLLAFPNLAASAYASTYVVGQALSVISTLNVTGVDSATGVYTFADVNKDGTVSIPADYQVGGHLSPDFYGGIGNTVRYKGWEGQVFFVFKKQRGATYLRTIYSQGLLPGTFNNQPTYVLDRWRQPGDQAPVQAFTATPGSAAYAAASLFGASDGGYGDASFVRLKTLALSYNLPSGLLKRGGLQGGKLYVQAQNLFTFTRYKGADPETQNLYALPPLRTLAAGVQLTF